MPLPLGLPLPLLLGLALPEPLGLRLARDEAEPSPPLLGEGLPLALGVRAPEALRGAEARTSEPVAHAVGVALAARLPEVVPLTLRLRVPEPPVEQPVALALRVGARVVEPQAVSLVEPEALGEGAAEAVTEAEAEGEPLGLALGEPKGATAQARRRRAARRRNIMAAGGLGGFQVPAASSRSA